MYSNSYCSYKFAPKQEKIGQSSHKEYSNNILKYLEFTAIINARTKKVWKLIECTSYDLNVYCFDGIACGFLQKISYHRLCRRGRQCPISNVKTTDIGSAVCTKWVVVKTAITSLWFCEINTTVFF